jgi:hypothetical protein
MTENPDHTVEWLDSGREPQCEPNPEYPNGCIIDCAENAVMRCRIKLQYPGPRCGVHAISCNRCGVTFALTAAGRPDDPKEVLLPCYIEIDETTKIQKRAA